MKRLILPYLLALVGVLLPVLPVQAATPVYAGNIQVTNGATLTFLNGASGCLIASNGIVAPQACPVGTVAFSAASPFTVTGTGPYVIGCPSCFTTSGGTITGATTIGNTLTLNGVLNATQSVKVGGGADGTAQLNIGTDNADNSDAIHIGSKCGTFFRTTLGSNSASTASGVPGSAFHIFCAGELQTLDLSGNAGFAGQVTATQFNVGSRREWKYDIQPLPFDALQVLHDTDFAAFRYRPGHGDPRLPHVGIIANDSPSVLSGEKHDHLDIEALATVDAKAILQLETQLQVLYILIGVLTILVLMLVVALGLVWRDQATR